MNTWPNNTVTMLDQYSDEEIKVIHEWVKSSAIDRSLVFFGPDDGIDDCIGFVINADCGYFKATSIMKNISREQVFKIIGYQGSKFKVGDMVEWDDGGHKESGELLSAVKDNHSLLPVISSKGFLVAVKERALRLVKSEREQLTCNTGQYCEAQSKALRDLSRKHNEMLSVLCGLVKQGDE